MAFNVRVKSLSTEHECIIIYNNLYTLKINILT